MNKGDNNIILNSIDEDIFNIFKIITKGNCKIAYIGLNSPKKDTLLRDMLNPFPDEFLFINENKMNTNNILEAFHFQGTTILSFISKNEHCAMDRLLLKLIEGNVEENKAERIIFSSIDFIIFYSSHHNAILSISEVNPISKKINKIINYNFINNAFKLENKISKEKVKFLLRQGVSIDKLERYTYSKEELFS